MHPGSLVERLVGACFMLLVGAIALDIAVHLIESIWRVLVVAGAVIAVVGGVIAYVRWRRQGW